MLKVQRFEVLLVGINMNEDLSVVDSLGELVSYILQHLGWYVIGNVCHSEI